MVLKNTKIFTKQKMQKKQKIQNKLCSPDFTVPRMRRRMDHVTIHVITDS